MPSVPSIPDISCEKPLRILVMRYRFIGDTLLTIPFLRNLRRACPQARIEVLVDAMAGDVLAACPYVDALPVLDDPPGGFWSRVRRVRAGRYDVAFVLKRSFSSALLAALAGIPKRIGFDTEARRWLLTRAVPYRRPALESQCFLDVLRAAGLPLADAGHLEAFWDEAADRAIAEKFPQCFSAQAGARHLLIHMTSSNPRKEWPLPVWIALTRWLVEEQGYCLYASGAPNDAPRYDDLIQALAPAARARFYNLCGQTSLPQTMALIQRMEGVIGVDSGVLHLAAAQQKPVIGLYTPMTNRSKWAPQTTPRAMILIRPTPPMDAFMDAFEEIRAACRACFPSLH